MVSNNGKRNPTKLKIFLHEKFLRRIWLAVSALSFYTTPLGFVTKLNERKFFQNDRSQEICFMVLVAREDEEKRTNAKRNNFERGGHLRGEAKRFLVSV